MAFNLKGRSLLTLKDYSAEEIGYLLNLAAQVKRERLSGEVKERFKGRSLALLFEKRSTRTRCAFETAFGEEGGHPVFLSAQDIHLGVKESIEDSARVFGRMFDAIQFRGFKQEYVEKLAQYSGIPVYNGLTDLYHPTQVLADLLTVQEVFGSLEGRKLAYVGDGRNNVARSLLIGCAKMGVGCAVIAPEGLQPEEPLLAYCREQAGRTGASITSGSEIAPAVREADAVYTDVWASMGEEEQAAERIRLLRPYQIDQKLMAQTGKPGTIFLHCLPAVKGNEVTVEVIEGLSSRVWDQAENRKHTIKALMLATI